MQNGPNFGSFAEAVTTLGKLTKMESAIQAAIKNSRVPPKEARKLLKCSKPVEAGNTPVFQFMRELFRRMELGDIEIASLDIFKLTFRVSDCPVCKLYPNVKGKHTCYVTTDALVQFFNKDLSIPSTAEEVLCKNNGDGCCEFMVSMQPLAVYQLALDACDREIIGHLPDAKEAEAVAKAAEISEAEAEYRLDALKRYHILDASNRLTEIGETYQKFGQSFKLPDEDFPPPWKDMSEISESISASVSFAEAFTEAAETEPIFDVKKEDIVNLAEKAKSSKSFAELLSKNISKEEE
jgi:predicted hydrocarbon binding protein